MSDDDSTPRIDVAIDDAAWRGALSDPAGCCRRAAEAALAEAPPAGASELSILLADDGTVGALNRRYRNRPGATNVLAFSCAAPRTPGAPCVLGDIVLARETVIDEAGAARLSIAEHVSHLVVHGTLHLLGYDHQDEWEAAGMERAEARALRRIGIADPYRTEEARE